MNMEYNGETTCPTCKRKLPKAMLDDAEKTFEKWKLDELASIKSEGEKLALEKLAIEERIETATSSLDVHNILISDAKSNLDIATKALNAISDTIADTSEIDEKINKLTERINAVDTNKCVELENKLHEIEKQVARIENNEIIDKRIVELNNRRIEVSQAIADAEKLKYMLEEYMRAKTKLLTEEVNSYFRYVDWNLFEEQINGGTKEVCNATIDGSVVGNGLNTGHTILAHLDICNAWSMVYDIETFVFVDNAESLSDETKTSVSNVKSGQLIFLNVAESELEVKG